MIHHTPLTATITTDSACATMHKGHLFCSPHGGHHQRPCAGTGGNALPPQGYQPPVVRAAEAVGRPLPPSATMAFTRTRAVRTGGTLCPFATMPSHQHPRGGDGGQSFPLRNGTNHQRLRGGDGEQPPPHSTKSSITSVCAAGLRGNPSLPPQRFQPPVPALRGRRATPPLRIDDTYQVSSVGDGVHPPPSATCQPPVPARRGQGATPSPPPHR